MVVKPGHLLKHMSHRLLFGKERCSEDLQNFIKRVVATAIKTSQLRWLGHVCRMEEQRSVKGFRRKTGGRRKRENINNKH
jgi:hypothetical protein